MTDVLPVQKKSAFHTELEDYNPSVFIGWRGLIRMLIFFNILGLLGIWASASNAREVGSELFLAPIKAFTGDHNEIDVKPVSAPLLTTQITTDITGHIVRTTVVQSFSNPTTSWMEGMYYFPLPDQSAVDHMVVKIEGRVIISEIQEKTQALRTYLKAAADGKVTALLDQYRPNVFSTRLANIEPHGSISVEISFQGLAEQNGSEFTWRMPQAITPRYTPQPRTETAQSRIHKIAVTNSATEQVLDEEQYAKDGKSNPSSFEIILQKSSRIAQIESPSHAIDTSQQDTDETLVRLTEGDVPADKDFILKWRFKQTENAEILLFNESKDEINFTLGLVLPPAVGNDVPESKRDVTFIIDVSGSMHGLSLRQGKDALLTALDLLKGGDRFDVIAFNNNFNRLFGNSEPATSETISYAKSFVRSLEATNGTEMYPALNSALEDSQLDGFQRQILFLTDGAVSNEKEMFHLVNEKLGKARLFTVGLGSAPNGWFMRKAAEFGRGIHVEISNLNRARTELEALFKDMASPYLEKITIDMGASADIYPKIIPDLFGQRPLVFVVRHTQDISDATVTARLPFGASVDMPLGSASQENSKGVSKLWAAMKVEGLTDALARGMGEDMVKMAVLDVALHHQIMSPYTSFVAVDKTPTRIKDDFLKKMKVKRTLPAGMSWQKIHGPQTATAMELYAWSGSVALLLALFLYFSRRRLGWLR